MTFRSDCEEDEGVGHGHLYCLDCERLQNGGGGSQTHELFFLLLIYSTRAPQFWVCDVCHGHFVALES